MAIFALLNVVYVSILVALTVLHVVTGRAEGILCHHLVIGMLHTELLCLHRDRPKNWIEKSIILKNIFKKKN